MFFSDWSIAPGKKSQSFMGVTWLYLFPLASWIFFDPVGSYRCYFLPGLITVVGSSWHLLSCCAFLSSVSTKSSLRVCTQTIMFYTSCMRFRRNIVFWRNGSCTSPSEKKIIPWGKLCCDNQETTLCFCISGRPVM